MITNLRHYYESGNLCIANGTADQVWRRAAEFIRSHGVEVSSRNFQDASKPKKTKELLHVMMSVQYPMQRLVFARPINPAFAVAEVIWILSGANDLAFVEFWNPRMKTWATGDSFWGAYGARLGSSVCEDEHLDTNQPHSSSDQLLSAYHTLSNNPDSRQVVLNIYNHNVDNSIDGTPNNPDIPCNLVADLKVRDGKLYWMQTMRSNDLLWGTPYNFMQWMSIQEIVAGWLGLGLGKFTLSVSSLHVYDHHYKELDDLVLYDPTFKEPEPPASLGIVGYDRWAKVFRLVEETARGFTKCQKAGDVIQDLESFEISSELYPGNKAGYFQWIYLLAAEAVRRLAPGDLAMQTYLISKAGDYYEVSWRQWRDYVTTT